MTKKDEERKKLNRKLKDMKRPPLPVEPKFENYKHFARHMGDKNIHGDPITSNPEYVEALRKYYKEKEQYDEDIKLWNQLKLIKKIKHASLATCITKYKIDLL
jgi:hypothetical protein